MFFNDQFALEFIEGGGDMEEQPPLWCAGVDVARQHLGSLFSLLEFVGGLNDLLEGSRQPGEQPARSPAPSGEHDAVPNQRSGRNIARELYDQVKNQCEV